MSKELILSIETSTAMCSVALSSMGKVLESRSDHDRRHASLTAVFCKEVLDSAGVVPGDLSAVCISDGPGSYTGLRVGLSTAKGICFGAGVKLLSVSSLDVLAAMGAQMLAENGGFAGESAGTVENGGSAGRMAGGASITTIIPMIDARRMEIFTARYDASGMKRLSSVEAVVVDTSSFADVAQNALFIGDGALKCRETIGAGKFVDLCPDASAMAALAHREYQEGNWRDVAYFEPFYLKDFVATTTKKKLF